jgi:hypothetical protein
MDTRKRRADGTFEPGGKLPENARRARGVQNKITRDIREGAIAGFARHGSNGRGEGGFAGFCFYLAKKHPKSAAKVIEKLLPLVVKGDGLGGANVAVQFNVTSVPSGSYLSQESIAQLRPEAPQIEHDESSAPTDEPGGWRRVV